MSLCVAIDGPAAAGKGTIAKGVAAQFGFAHLDTGLLYRAVGARMLEGIDPVQAARTLDPAAMDEAALRTGEVAQAASKVAAMSEVRAALVDFQRAFGARAGGAVLDGRDIGTVICPDAAVKLFVTASDEVRAARRYAELSAKGHDVTLDGVFADIKARDARDASRDAAPMAAAADAVLLDTTHMDIDAALAAAIAAVRERLE
ncbi:MAG: (d)CMP kinase [Pseudomonadota bacterium]